MNDREIAEKTMDKLYQDNPLKYAYLEPVKRKRVDMFLDLMQTNDAAQKIWHDHCHPSEETVRAKLAARDYYVDPDQGVVTRYCLDCSKHIRKDDDLTVAFSRECARIGEGRASCWACDRKVEAYIVDTFSSKM